MTGLQIGLIAGVTVSNVLINLMTGRTWFDSLGIGITSGVVCLVLVLLFGKFFQ